MLQKQRKISAKQSIIFYDATCGFCTHWVAWAQQKDTLRKFTFSAIGSKLFLQRLQKKQQIHSAITLLEKKTVLSGFAAIQKILRQMPAIQSQWGIRIILWTPQMVGKLCYGWVANHRRFVSRCWKILNQCLIRNSSSSNGPDGGIGRHASLRDLYQ